jgi:hypothetical protein
MKRNLKLGIALFLLAFALVFTGCPEPEKPKDVPANTSETRPQALTDGVWYDGELVIRGNEIWFSFPVTAGRGYDLTWNDSYQGDSSKTADVYVNVKFQGDATELRATDRDSGWNEPWFIFASQTGTALVKVRGLANTDIGTFAIKYSSYPTAGTEGNAIPLQASTWYEDGELTSAGQIFWFSFPVTNGIVYNIYWDDSYQGSGQETADIYVNGRYGDATSSLFYDRDSAYNTPYTFTADRNGFVLLRVRGFLSTTRGTFAITYTIGTGVQPSIKF